MICASGFSDADDLARRIEPLEPGVGHLVEHHDIGELDLVDQQIDQRALVLFAKALAAVADEVMTGIVVQKVHRVDHRHHRVEARGIRQAFAVLVAEIEGGGHRKRLGDAGALDQQVIEAALLGQPAHLDQQVVAQRAADAAVGHLDQLLLGLAEVCATVAHEVRVDVHLGHVVDDHRDAAALAIVEHVVEKRGLPGPEEARQDGDRQAGVAGWHDGLRSWIVML